MGEATIRGAEEDLGHVQTLARGSAQDVAEPPRLPRGDSSDIESPRISMDIPWEEVETILPNQRFETYGLVVAVLLHVALFALLSARFTPTIEPIPPGAMEVTYVTDPGAPPEGDPKGSIEPSPTKAPDTPPADQQPTEVEEKEPDPETPPDPEPQPDPEKPQTDATQTDTKQQIESPLSTTDGAGALALGAKTHGDAQGLDPRLSASVGQAVATRVRTCWTPPRSGVASGTATMIIVRYLPDGSVEGEPSVVRIVNEQQVPVPAPSGWELEAVEAIKRCSPIGLPSGIYAYWREVEVQIFSAALPTPTIRP